MFKRKWLGCILVAVLLAVSLAACGGGRDNSPSADSAASAPAAAPTEAPTEAPAAPVGDAAVGKETYDKLCIACHGPGGVGVEGLGKDMTHSEFIAGLTDAELLEFIKVGRDPSSPDNTTGIAMPPKGGNPALTDEQLLDVIAYMRSIHQP